MNKNKRDVLKGLAVGSVWATPVVSSVMLPAHAITSGAIYSATGLLHNGTTQNSIDSHSLIADLTNSLIPKAHAKAGGEFYACAIVSESTAYVSIAGFGFAFGSTVGMIRRGVLNLPSPENDGAYGTITASDPDISPCVTSGVLSRPARIVSRSSPKILIMRQY